MAFCPSCGAENPDVAKFCAKCGQALVVPDSAATQPQAPAAAQAQPRPVSQPAPQPQAQPQPVPQPAPQAQRPAQAQMTAKSALASPPVPKPSKVRSEPDPNAPGQTQFFMAAAGVSTGSKIKRIILFIIGAVIVGTGIFLLINYGFIKKEPPKMKPKATQGTTMEPMKAPVAQPKPDEAATKDAKDVKGTKDTPKTSTKPKGKKKSH